MSADDKNEIGGYSADYRDTHAGNSHQGGQRRRSSPKLPEQEELTGWAPQEGSPASDKAAPQKGKGSASAETASAEAVPVREIPRKQPSPPKQAERSRGRLENETEIDDFLPESDSIDDERMLTKWDDGLDEEFTLPQQKKRGRHRYGMLVGTLVLLFALVGVGFLATAIGQKIHAVVTDDSKLRAYDKFLTVVVAQDPKPFASPDKADPDFVLNASLWQTMTADGANYTDYDDAGRTIVPLGDVVDACHTLFGPDCQLQPKNPAQETFFEYDSAKAQFHVSLYSLDSTYVPYTESEKKSGDTVTLHVGYVPPSDETRASSGASSGGTPTPTKYMDYVLKTDPATQQQYVYAIQAPTS